MDRGPSRLLGIVQRHREEGPSVQDQPTEPMPGVPDEQAPNPNLRAARTEIRDVESMLRKAIAEDDKLAGHEDAGR
jgi:hypothetical protein